MCCKIDIVLRCVKTWWIYSTERDHNVDTGDVLPMNKILKAFISKEIITNTCLDNAFVFKRKFYVCENNDQHMFCICKE